MSAPPCRFGWRLPIEITLASPFVTRGLNPADTVIDTSLPRDGQGRVVLPGSLVQGTIRDALETIAKRVNGLLTLEGVARDLDADIALLFGTESGKRTPRDPGEVTDRRVNNTPERALLAFSDLAATTPERGSGSDGVGHQFIRVEIDDDLGAVREGHIQRIELPWPIGTPVAFAGEITLRPHPDAEPARVKALLDLGLRLVPALGAVKSAGFGERLGHTIEDAIEVTVSPTAAARGRTDLTFALGLDRPFLVAATRAADNVYRGSEVIPGGVIKGALAEALKAAGAMDGAMADFLARLTITHAFPASKAAMNDPATRRRVLPLSLVMAGKKPVDILCDGGASRLADGLRFEVDWKEGEHEAAFAVLGWDDEAPERDVRTHTAIDRERGAAKWDQEAQAGMLYSTSAVKPDGFEWIGRLALDPPDDDRLGVVMAILEQGLPGIGKTAAIARASWLAEPPPQPEPLKGRGGEPPFYALTLQTPALLNDLGALRNGVAIGDDYARYWRGRGYRLVRFFAHQKLAGGHLALRYPPRADRYDVYLVTEPGSVFLVTPDPSLGTAVADLGTLLRFGLLPDPSITRRHWTECPFLPENGFGGIACNVVDHGRPPVAVTAPKVA